MAGHEGEFQNITYITREGENNDLLDVAEGFIQERSPELFEQTKERLQGLRDEHQSDNGVNVTQNELDQIISMLENAMNHRREEVRIDYILLVLQEFIAHQKREQNRERVLTIPQLQTFMEGLTPIIEENNIAKNYDSWFGGDSDYIFILIPQKHKSPLDSSLSNASKEVLQIQQREILPLLLILGRNNICNIHAAEGIKLLDGPISQDRLLGDLDYLPSVHNASLIAEVNIPEIDTFGVESHNDGRDLRPVRAFMILTDSMLEYMSKDGAQEDFLNRILDNNQTTHQDFFDFINVPYDNRSEISIYLDERGVSNPSNFSKYFELIQKMQNEDIFGQFHQARLAEGNRDITDNLSRIQENTNTNCVSLVMGAGHFDDISEMGGKSIQRILRERGISYVTLAPYSVDMEGYDFVE